VIHWPNGTGSQMLMINGFIYGALESSHPSRLMTA
jgi:hypothetical protein